MRAYIQGEAINPKEDQLWVNQGIDHPSLRNPYKVGDNIIVPAGSYGVKSTYDKGTIYRNEVPIKADMSIEVTCAWNGRRYVSGGIRWASLPQVEFEDENGGLGVILISQNVIDFNEKLPQESEVS